MSTLAPTNDGELIRSLNSRITSLENSVTQRVGSFVLSDKNGSLMATGLDAEPVDLLGGGGISDDALKNLITSQQLDDALTGFVQVGPDGLIDSSLLPDFDLGDITTAIEEAIGQAITGLEGGLSTLTTWAEGIPILGDLVHAITGITDGGLPDLTSWASDIPILSDIVGWITGEGGGGSVLANWGTNLKSLLGGVDLFGSSGSFDPIEGFKQLLSEVGIGAGVQTTTSPVLAHQYGSLNTGAFAANALIDADCSFDDPTTLDGQLLWVWDGTVDHTGKTGSGSAKCVASGILLPLIGVPITTKPAQLTNLGGYFRWRSLVGTGAVITLNANAYDSGDVLISDPVNRVIATITSPTASSIGWAGADADGWVYLSGNYEAPAGTAYVRISPEVQAAATAGSVWFDDALQQLQGPIDATTLGNWENLVPGTLPAEIVAAVQGLANLPDLFSHVFDNLGAAFSNTPQTGLSLADLFHFANQSTTQATQANSLATAIQQLLGIRTNKSTSSGANATSEAMVSLAHFGTGGTVTSTALATGQSIAQVFRPSESATKGFIEFVAQSNGSNGVYLNLHKWSGTNWASIWNSADIASTLPGTLGAPIRALISGGSQPAMSPGETYLVQLVNNTGSALNVATKSTGIGNNTNEAISNMAATRTISGTGGVSPGTLTNAQITYTGNVPYFNLGILNVPAGYMPPITVPFNPGTIKTGGTITYNIPAWAQVAGVIFDLIALGGGGGGCDSAAFATGNGGLGGNWLGRTVTYGTEIPLGTTQLVIHYGAGGDRNSYGSGGHAGASTTIALPGGTVLLTATGGVGGQPFTGSNGGNSPGNFQYDNEPYFGGSTVSTSTNGSSPGGGGGGGFPYDSGNPGADGAAWLFIFQPGTH